MKRLTVTLLLAAAGCTQANDMPDASKETSKPMAQTDSSDPIELVTFDKRQPSGDEVIPPPILTRLTGTLVRAGTCLAIDTGGELVAVGFETGSARFDPVAGALSIDGQSFAIGDPISVGGPFTQPSADFDMEATKARCGVERVWLVVSGDVSATP